MAFLIRIWRKLTRRRAARPMSLMCERQGCVIVSDRGDADAPR